MSANQNSNGNSNSSASSRPQPNGVHASPTSMADDVASIAKLLADADAPDDAAEHDIAALLRRLEQANSAGADVEGRLDALLGQLDGLLGELQPEAASGGAAEADSAAAAVKDGR